jgi:uncharacterized membrane protein
MMNSTIWMIILAMFPVAELRASIPYGILIAKMPWLYVFALSVVFNILAGIAAYILIDKFIHIFLRIKSFAKIWNKYVASKQKAIKSSVNKYGEAALAIFIGIPAPGTGAYSGAIVAYALGMDFKKFLIANVVGVLMAGIIVLALCMTGSGIFLALRQFFIKV